jgi:hypothetical protein
MTTIEKAKRLINSREGADAGRWNYTYGDYVGFVGEQFFNVVTNPENPDDSMHVCGPRVRLENAEFICIAANDAAEISRALLIAVQALELLKKEFDCGADSKETWALEQIAKALAEIKGGK